MNQQLAVQCSNIIKSFYDEKVLQGVTLEVICGELLMLVGPSGCGKTTLLSIIAGILDSDDGSCVVFGNNYSEMNELKKIDFRAKNIGFIFQSFNLINSLSVAENVAIPLMINNMSRKNAKILAIEMLAEVGLEDKAFHSPVSLSGGQQQRVAIARALIHNPALLICDEPTSALDHKSGLKIMDLIHRISRQHKTTVIVVTHDNRILNYADRIAHVNDGVIVNINQPIKLMEK